MVMPKKAARPMSGLRLLADRSYLAGTTLLSEFPMPIILIIIALVLHLLLGWPLWVSVLIAGGGQTAMAIVGRKRLGIPIPAPISHIIAGAIIGILLSYIPMVLVSHWTGHPSW
jgi:hypothetical protein